MSFVGQFLAVIEVQSHHISDPSSTQNACHVISLSIKDEDLVGVRRVLEISTAKTNEDAKRKYSALWVPDHEVLDERMRRTMVLLLNLRNKSCIRLQSSCDILQQQFEYESRSI